MSKLGTDLFHPPGDGGGSRVMTFSDRVPPAWWWMPERLPAEGRVTVALAR